MRKGCGWTLVVAASGLALVVGLFARRVDLGSALDDLDRAERDYRAQGLPWTAADLARPPVPPERNAAPLLRKAFAALPKRVGFRWVDDILARIAPDLKALPLAQAAAARPDLDMRLDRDLGLHMGHAGYFDVSRLAGDLAARAELRAAKGDDAGALADLEDSRRLDDLLNQEPSMSAALAGLDAAQNAYTSAPRCLVHCAGNLTRLRRYRGWLAAPLALPDLARIGRWPTSCPVMDPLGDGPLRMRLEQGRFRVWSVGPDGKDDEGLTPAEAYAVESGRTMWSPPTRRFRAKLPARRDRLVSTEEIRRPLRVAEAPSLP